jgi:hypothetical protein
MRQLLLIEPSSVSLSPPSGRKYNLFKGSDAAEDKHRKDEMKIIIDSTLPQVLLYYVCFSK